MLIPEMMYSSNSFEDLKKLKGEIIKGVLRDGKEIYLILESGFAVGLSENGNFKIITKSKIDAILDKKHEELKKNIEEITDVLEAAGEELNPYMNK